MVPVALAVASSSVLTHLLAAGLVASRFGLWSFDLAVLQMLQERVGNRELGVHACLAPSARPSHELRRTQFALKQRAIVHGRM